MNTQTATKLKALENAGNVLVTRDGAIDGLYIRLQDLWQHLQGRKTIDSGLHQGSAVLMEEAADV